MSRSIQGLKFFLRTFGCQMNENDSEHIAGILVRAGAQKADTPEASDIIIVNTCAVRAKSEEKLSSYLGRLSALRKKRDIVIGVAGCVAQVQKAALFKKKPGVDFVVGPDNYLDIPAIVEQAASGRCCRTGRDRRWHEVGGGETRRESAVSAYVTIMEGCDNFCTYCIVPFSRGREKYRGLRNILAEVRELADAGYREVQLLGQNVNSYRDPETGRGFAELLDDVSRVRQIEWIRFITSHPRTFGNELIAAMARSPKVCRQLHLPLQSGSTAVLGRMNRGYDREQYLDLVDRLKAGVPGISLSTDIIVGFPGETVEDFAATRDAVQSIRFAGIFSFHYSPRPLTAAAKLADDVTQAVKRRRLLEIQALQRSIQLDIHESFVGSTVKVLCTGPSPKGGGRIAGRTEGNQVVNFEAPVDVIGSFVKVLITGCGPYSLHGRLAD